MIVEGDTDAVLYRASAKGILIHERRMRKKEAPIKPIDHHAAFRAFLAPLETSITIEWDSNAIQAIHDRA